MVLSYLLALQIIHALQNHGPLNKLVVTSGERGGRRGDIGVED